MDNFQLDLGQDDFAPIAPPAPAPRIPELEGLAGDDDFSPATLASARELSHMSPHTIFRAIFNLQCAKLGLGSRRIEDMSFDQFVMMGAVASTLGSSRSIKKRLGDVDPEHLRALEGVDLATLRAALVEPRAASNQTLTSTTLAAHISQMKGVVVLPDGEFVIPGCTVGVRVALKGPSRLRVTHGGDEFVAWHNRVWGTDYVYKVIGTNAAVHAFFLNSRYKVEFGDEDVTFSVPQPDKSRFASFVGQIPPVINAYMGPLQKRVKLAYSRKEFRPSFGRAKEKLAYLEVLLQNQYDGEQAAALENMTKLTELIKAEHANLVARIRAPCGGILDERKYPTKEQIAGASRAGISIPEVDVQINTYGALGHFVQNHRDKYRARNDVPHKADAPGSGAAAGVASSVALKTANAIRTLEAMVNVLNVCDAVDAWGVGDHNWWQAEIQHKYPAAKFFDKSDVRLPGPLDFTPNSNILALAPGSKRGHCILDDTLLVAEGANQKDMTKCHDLPKVDAIIAAGYECGFIKLMLGGKDDAQLSIGAVPPAIMALHHAYWRVEMSQGGGPHSPEYFAVFSGKKAAGPCEGYLSPVMRVTGRKDHEKMRFMPAAQKTCSPDLVATSFRNYVGTFFILKAMEMVRANIHQSAAAYFGFVPQCRVKSFLRPLRYNLALHLGGWKANDSQVQEAALGGDFNPKFEIDFGAEHERPLDPGDVA